jgi:hypothetical protein
MDFLVTRAGAVTVRAAWRNLLHGDHVGANLALPVVSARVHELDPKDRGGSVTLR